MGMHQRGAGDGQVAAAGAVLSADYMNAGKLVELEDEVVVTEQQLAVIRTMHEVY